MQLIFAKRNKIVPKAWNSILEIIDIIIKSLRWIVGNDKSINFWTFNWVCPFPLINLIPENLRTNIDWNINVSDFITNKNWDRDKLLSLIDQEIVKQIMW